MSTDNLDYRYGTRTYSRRVRGALGGAALVGALVSAGPAWAGPIRASGGLVHKHRHPAPAKPGPLSGKWAGSYSGTFSGTFHLTWQELRRGLSGTIAISGFGNTPTSIHGVVNGNSISFGTVGSKSITYSGSVSGSSMSGTWKIEGGGQSLGGGSWKASRTG